MPKPQYGKAHRAERKRWAQLIERGDITCCLCHDPLMAGQAWDLDHEPGTDRYRGAAHAYCNRSDGAKRRDAMRGGVPRWVL